MALAELTPLASASVQSCSMSSPGDLPSTLTVEASPGARRALLPCGLGPQSRWRPSVLVWERDVAGDWAANGTALASGSLLPPLEAKTRFASCEWASGAAG